MERMERLERAQRSPRLEVTCRKFAVLSGIQQDADDFITCVQPRAGSRKGTLALLTEPAGDHPSLAADVCALVQRVIVDHYIADNSLSLTSGFLGALDAANSAVLSYNYGVERDEGHHGQHLMAVRTGGRGRRVKVGLTGVMLRSDGTGVYLAQMAPAQAYIRHNGMVTPIPETPGWRSQYRPQSARPTLSVVRDEDDEEVEQQAELEVEQPEAEEEFEYTPDFTQENLLAPALGTSPGVESDLIYRRVEPGDMIVMVSSSLARLLDRETAEDLLSAGDADAVSDALYDLATERGLAQAHACVLALGGGLSSGVDVEWSEPAISPVPLEEEAESPAPEEAQPGRLATLKGTLLSPMSWLGRRQQSPTVEDEPEEAYWQDEEPETLPAVVEGPWLQGATTYQEVDTEDEAAAPEAATEYEAEAQTEDSEGDSSHDSGELPGFINGQYRPTRAFVQPRFEVPPYKAPVLWTEEDETEDAPFDGWEDNPPALYGEAEGDEATQQAIFPWQKDSQRAPLTDTPPAPKSEPGSVTYYPAPVLFGNGRDEKGGAQMSARRAFALPSLDAIRSRLPRRVPVDFGKVGRGVVSWAGSAARNMLPDRQGQPRRPRLSPDAPVTRAANRINIPRIGTISTGKVPVRLLTAVALVVVLGLLAWSVLRVVGNGKQTQATNYLQQARQEELLANQPSTSDSERMRLLDNALQHAKQAVAAEPGSNDARLFVDKVQGEIDKAQGITRLAKVAPLFSFGPAAATASGTQVAAPPVSAGQLNVMVLLGNQLFVLDNVKGNLYKCVLGGQSCTATLSQGDTAGGQQVGKVVALSLTNGGVVAVDDKLSAYTLAADGSGWQAQQLGDTDKLAPPKAIATYDGNIYLLNSRPGQVQKYVAGKYGASPDDWIKDPATLSQVGDVTSFAIDGSIYMLRTDGSIVVMQGGKAVRTITAKLPDNGTGAPNFIYTNTDLHDIYLLRTADGTVTRVTKDGNTVATYKAPLSEAKLQTLTGVTVDEAYDKVYITNGQTVYQAAISGEAAPQQVDTTTKPALQAPKPTVEP